MNSGVGLEAATPVPPPAPATRPTPATRTIPSRATVHDWIEARALFIVAASAVLILTIAGIPQHISQDSWLALVAGRLVATHGIPHHDYFTLMTHGVNWVDQQWLAQFLMYELQRLGGLQVMTVVYVLITSAAFAGTIVVARRLGGQDLHVLAMLPLGAFFYLAAAVWIRTQGLAYPLFITTLYLLATDARAPQPLSRTWLVFPMLILWANLHGSVTLGVGLAVLYGAIRVVRCIRGHHLISPLGTGAVAFIVLPPLTLLVTPYGTSIVHYYRVTLLNPEFGKLVTEWKPVTSVPLLAVPLFVLIAGALYTLARTWRRTPVFELLVIVALAFGAVDAVRNITWFGLAVIMLLPSAIDKLKAGRPAPLRRARINRILATVIGVLALGITVLTLARPESWFTSTYPTSAIPTLEHLMAQDHQDKVFADIRFADWLIWQDPRVFSGHVAYDTSLELLTGAQLRSIVAVTSPGRTGIPAVLSPYRIWALNPSNRAADRSLLARRGVHLILKSKRIVIATHRPRLPGV
jgi:hypothetical protein